MNDPQGLVLDSLQAGTWATWDRADELWKTTCFEAFLSLPNSNSYWEINLSPAKQYWNVYSFDDYRVPQPPSRSEDFALSSIQATRTSLVCRIISKNEIPQLEASLCAVIRTNEGSQYHSCTHAGEKPDFHNRRSFILKI